MNYDKTSYKQILKSTSLFGGVQVFTILISVIKTKVVTLLIGATGFGILGLLTTTLRVVVDFTKLGLDTSAVKEVSEYYSGEKKKEYKKFVYILKKLFWITGVFGALLTIIFSKWLSLWTFGDSKYTYAFIWLSISVLLAQLASGKKVILQGTHKLRRLAKANLWGSFLSLIVSVPLYYFFKLNGIVPSIVISFFISYLVFYYYEKEKDNEVQDEKLGLKEIITKSKDVILLGATMSLNALLVALTLWLIQVYIRDSSGLDTVGFYNAGLLVINSYVGMVFNAMGTDYYPRLAAINKDKELISRYVNEQADIAVLIITCVITVFLTFIPQIITVLYTKEFFGIKGLLTFGILGTLFKAVSFSLGYVIIAKGDRKVFLKTSIGFNLLMFFLCIYSFSLGGLTGVGVGLLIYYVIHLVSLKVIIHNLYGITLSKSFYRTFLICFCICLISYLTTFISRGILRYPVMLVVVVISVIFTWNELQKRIDLNSILKNIFNSDKN
ncbi:oligosaccharide flippase family protein [Aestuariibaculum lutulentum]|uniref:Oligosaccharide flippase family protein n=1 Tax=Aestuariibaculum lutulentum TaxID=2920935 RepID=A0ABS9RGY0_9FLAO|nr:oligosaccharide flippase family protein [Aestuariibaculum lutulentum]MCH4551352.1 oligosaccharide flippase family protein [Aestuariibaculum lutulentum]